VSDERGRDGRDGRDGHNGHNGHDVEASVSGEFRTMESRLSSMQSSRSSWRRIGVVLGAVSALLAVVATLNAVGPCRQSWAFADGKTNETEHNSMGKRLDGHDASIKVLQGSLGQIDVTTWKIWCSQQWPGDTTKAKSSRRECEHKKPPTLPVPVQP